MSQRRRRGTAVLVAGALLATVGFTPTLIEGLVTGAATGTADLSMEGGEYRPQADSSVDLMTAEGRLPEYITRRDQVARTGVFSPDAGIAVANLTVRPGSYIVNYDFEARFDAAGGPAKLRCGIVDNNGYQSFFVEDPEPIASGSGWTRRSLSASFSLPDVTLGIRCTPSLTGLIRATFRDVTFSVIRAS